MAIPEAERKKVVKKLGLPAKKEERLFKIESKVSRLENFISTAKNPEATKNMLKAVNADLEVLTGISGKLPGNHAEAFRMLLNRAEKAKRNILKDKYEQYKEAMIKLQKKKTR